MEDNKIRAMFIFEILGRPPEHIKETLSQLVDKLNDLPGIKIEKKNVHDAKLVENKENQGQELFTSFADVEILADNLNDLLAVVFHMLPAHVEIIEPKELKFANFDLSNMLSDLTVKLHRYDEIAKGLTMERNILMKRLEEADGKIKELGGESILKKKD